MSRLVDLILLLTAVEAVVVMAVRRVDLLVTLAAGVALLLALRCALTGASWVWICLCLLGGLLAHVADVAQRRKKGSASF